MKQIQVLPIVPEFYNTADILYNMTVMLTRLEYVETEFPVGEDSRAFLF